MFFYWKLYGKEIIWCIFSGLNCFIIAFFCSKNSVRILTYVSFIRYLCTLKGPSWSWLYGSLIYNYLCKQCLSPLRLWVWILLIATTFFYDFKNVNRFPLSFMVSKDKLNWKGPTKAEFQILTFLFFIQFWCSFLQNNHLNRLLMDHKNILSFCFENASKSRKIQKICIFVRHIHVFNTWNSKTRQMSKIQLVQHIIMSSNITVSTPAFNIHLFNFPLLTGTPVSSTNKTDLRDITEILLTAALSIIP
jgi:hypothetical protein